MFPGFLKERSYGKAGLMESITLWPTSALATVSTVSRAHTELGDGHKNDLISFKKSEEKMNITQLGLY